MLGRRTRTQEMYCLHTKRDPKDWIQGSSPIIFCLKKLLESSLNAPWKKVAIIGIGRVFCFRRYPQTTTQSQWRPFFWRFCTGFLNTKLHKSGIPNHRKMTKRLGRAPMRNRAKISILRPLCSQPLQAAKANYPRKHYLPPASKERWT